MTDGEIEAAIASDPDTVALNRDFWRSAQLVEPEPKVPLSVRVDRDVLDFFKAAGKGYQTRMNAVLRAYMLQARKQAARRKTGSA
ncbi:MAG: BrnA antitoxin family protein [Rhodospirillaceae bacterium]|nr:BrnA antitoxin family protein [Rhodospirillaceae bacterium]